MNYHYNSNQQPNTVRGIYGSHHHDMRWDAKGNLVRHRNHHAGYDRRLCWDEQNRLMGVADNSYLSLYQYDANGDRTYKLTGRIERQNVSGGWRYFYVMDKPTLYTSPYLVATRHGYTKHYYTENERVASRIGGGGLHDLDEIVDEKMFHDHRNRANMLFQRVQECMEAAMETEESPLRHLYDWRDINEDENRCYWYHTDHLGSSSWITYTNGSAVEHLHYLPWGEDFVRQRHTNYHARYTFSGKEKDAETGYSYFGSRYYSSDLSIWLSVDPQSDKYPSFSPYVYCANNPIKLVDPNGEEIVITETVDKNGNKVVDIKFTATLANRTSKDISKSDMEAYKNDIVKGINYIYGGQKDDGTIVNVNVDINILENGELLDPLSTRHTINIVDKLDNPKHVGEAEIGGGSMGILIGVCDGSYSDNSLKRTVAHEFGHLLGLDHVKDEDNIMYNESNGIVVTGSQIQEACRNFRDNRMNNNIQGIKVRNEHRRKNWMIH